MKLPQYGIAALIVLVLGFSLAGFVSKDQGEFNLDELEQLESFEQEELLQQARTASEAREFDTAKKLLEQASNKSGDYNQVQQVATLIATEREEQKKREAQQRQEKQRLAAQQAEQSESRSSRNSSSSASSSNCKESASLAINVSGDLELEPQFKVTPPRNVDFSGGGGFLFSNTNSDTGSIYSHSGCIAGTYQFVYSYSNDGQRTSYSGSFYLDGKQSYYDINILGGGLFSGPSVSVY